MRFNRGFVVAAAVAAALGLGTAAMAQVRAIPSQPFMRNFTAVPLVQTGQQRPQPLNKKKTFVGKIAKSANGSYVLQVAGMSYHLDGSGLAAKYLGKEVKVTGVLDAKTNTIRVVNIRPV